MRALVILAGLGLFSGPVVSQQHPTETLRGMFASAGFDEAISAPGAHDLDRALTSSDFAASPNVFLAAYYFKDEMDRGIGLGSLHVSRFDRASRRWTDAPRFREDVSGSVLSVTFTARYVFLGLHWNPSAGQGVVLDKGHVEVRHRRRGFS